MLALYSVSIKIFLCLNIFLSAIRLQPGFVRLPRPYRPWNCQRGRQYNQNFTTNTSCLQEWEDRIVSLPVLLLPFIMWPSKRRVPQIWWVLCEVDPGGEILTSTGSIFHPKSLETDLKSLLLQGAQLVSDGSWLTFIYYWLRSNVDQRSRDERLYISLSIISVLHYPKNNILHSYLLGLKT